MRNISKPTRRSMLKHAGAVLASPLLATSARAQEWPARPVRVIVPYPPGIPVLLPGEVVTADKLAYLTDGLERGITLSGASDPTFATIRIVAE